MFFDEKEFNHAISGAISGIIVILLGLGFIIGVGVSLVVYFLMR